MPPTDTAEPLAPDRAVRLNEFARACKTAARVVALYPATHPALGGGLERVAAAAERLRGKDRATIAVTPDAMLLDGQAAQKPDAAVADLAALLHSHLVGELTLTGELTTTAWHAFLSLLARTPEDVRAAGGIGRAWSAAGGGAIEIREIDYAEVLRERKGALRADWERVIANYLEGDLADIDDAAMAAVIEFAGDQARLKDFTEDLVNKAAEGGPRSQRQTVLKVLQALADYVARTNPEQLDRILHRIAGVIPKLTPDMVVTLITTGAPIDVNATATGIDLPGEVRARISDNAVAEFVAQSIARDNGATARLAQAFQALVPEPERRGQLLDTAESALEAMPLGRQAAFPDLWKSATDLLTSYSDSSFVRDDYARELSTARAQAIEVERVSDDPPERVSSWLSTVRDEEIRKLDQRLLLDLLRLETREEEWKKVLDTTIGSVERLVLAGNIGLGQELIEALFAAAEDGQPFAAAARSGLDRLRAGKLIQHIVLFIRQTDKDDLAPISKLCHTVGTAMIAPLAEALAAERDSSAIKRLREVLLSFGAAGRQCVDELKSSPRPAARRTAMELLRLFGGAEALADLSAHLNDEEPAVQREAARGILQIGSEKAYAAVTRALETANRAKRESIMQALTSARDERTAPMFVYVLEHASRRGEMESVYLAAVDALGRIGGDDASVAALRKALDAGDWWAPLRTSRLRRAVAQALRAAGTEGARRVLEQAATGGSAGVRRAARAALASSAGAQASQRKAV